MLGGPEMVFPAAPTAGPALAAMAQRVRALAASGRRTLVLARSPGILTETSRGRTAAARRPAA